MGASQSTGAWSEIDLGEPLPKSGNHQQSDVWSSIHPAVYKKSRQVTVFIRDFEERGNEETQQFFQNGLQILKQLRHPNIVQFVAGSYSPNDCFLVTNRVFTLNYTLDTLAPAEILTGLLDLLDALRFLHNVANISHNNLCPNAVYVDCESGGWQLGSFECANRLSDNKHWVLSEFAKSLQVQQFMPPEDQELVRKEVPPHARDVFAFGKLIEYMRPYYEMELDESQMSELTAVVSKMTSTLARDRPPISQVSLDVIATDLTKIKDFLRTLPEQGLMEKEDFFLGLNDRLRALPADVVARRLCKLLLSRYVLLEQAAVQYFLRDFLTIQPDYQDSPEHGHVAKKHIFTLASFHQTVIPELVRIFCVHETGVRLAILAHFDVFATSIPKHILEKNILPELLLGMKDANDQIVASSLHAMAQVVLLLGAPNVTGFIHQQYFSDGRPKDWIQYESNQHVRYTHIPAASQLMTVKAALHDQIHSDDELLTSTPVSAKLLHTAIDMAPGTAGHSVLVQVERGGHVTRSHSDTNFDKPLQVDLLSKQQHRAQRVAEKRANIEARRALRSTTRMHRTSYSMSQESLGTTSLRSPIDSDMVSIAADLMHSQAQLNVPDPNVNLPPTYLMDEHKTTWSAWDEALPVTGESMNREHLASNESIIEDSKSYFPPKPESFRTPPDTPERKANVESNKASPSRASTKSSKPVDGLGAEYDVHAIEFDTEQNEKPATVEDSLIDDFLSQMQPNLASLAWEDRKFYQRRLERNEPKMKSADTDALAVVQHVTSKFQMADADLDVEVSESAWGDAGWVDED